MPERRDLVRIPTVEFVDSALFTNEQKDILIRQTNLYLQNKKIKIDKNSFSSGVEVISDALKRGLGVYGAELSDAGRGLVKFVKTGLEERERIKTVSRALIQKASDYKGEYLGDFAISKELISQALEEQSKFDLRGNITHSENLNRLMESRGEDLEVLASKVISYLPETLIANAKAKIQTDEERSKLVKNAIVSSVFADSETPLISIEELWNYFNQYSGQSEKYFSDNNFLSFIKELNLEGRQKVFLKDLFSQTKEDFESKKDFNIKSRDEVYSRFSRDLLLLHPALEEEQIVIDYDRQDGYTQSIWDEGVSIKAKGFRIPSKGILLAALRQAQAAGSLGRAERIKSAMNSWHYYENEKVRHPQRIKGLRSQVRVQEKRLEALMANWTGGEIRKNAVGILDEKTRSLGKASLLYKTVANQISDSRVRVRQAEHLVSVALGSKDQTFKLPKEYYLEILSRKISRGTAVITSISASIEKSGSALREFSYSRNKADFVHESISRIGHKPLKGEDFSKSVDTFKRVFGTVMHTKDTHIFKNIPEDLMVEFSDFLVYQLSLLSNKSFKDHYGFSKIKRKDISNLIGMARTDPKNLESLNMASRVILAQTKPYIERLERQNKSLKRAKFNLHQAEVSERSVLKQEEMGSDSVRTLSWARFEYRSRLIGDLTSDIGENLNYNEVRFSRLRGIDVLSEYLPKKVSKESFREEIKAAFPILKKKIAEKEEWVEKEKEFDEQLKKQDSKNYKERSIMPLRLGNLRAAQKDLEMAELFLEEIDANSRLLALNLAEGMLTENYLRLISRKTLLLHRIQELPELKEDYDRLLQDVSKLRDEVVILKTMNKKESIEKKLEEVRSHDVTDVLIARMQELGFAVKA